MIGSEQMRDRTSMGRYALTSPCFVTNICSSDPFSICFGTATSCHLPKIKFRHPQLVWGCLGGRRCATARQRFWFVLCSWLSPVTPKLFSLLACFIPAASGTRVSLKVSSVEW